MMYLVDQPKPCAQIYLQSIAFCMNLQLPIVFFKSIISDMHHLKTYMHHHKTYMYINFQQNRVSQKPCTQIYFVFKNLKKKHFIYTNFKIASFI